MADIKYNDQLRLIIRGLNKYGEMVVKVNGESMSPVITENTTVKIIKVKYNQIKVSDWVAITKNSRLVIHEVIFKNKKYVVTWGVNNDFIDGKIRPNQIIGIVGKKPIYSNQNKGYITESKKITKLFKKNKIKHIILKGSPWQENKYGYLLDREISDIDILIDKNKYQQVKKILIERNYNCYETQHNLSEICFIKNTVDGNLIVDLHLQAIRESMTFPYKEPISKENMNLFTSYLLSRGRSKRGFVILSDTDTLLYLCINIMIHHAGRGLYQLANIARIVDRDKVDWPTLVKLANMYKFENYIYIPLIWASKLFGTIDPTQHLIRPSRIRLLLVKLLINRKTIFLASGTSRADTAVKLISVALLRVILSAFRKRPQ